MDGDNVEVAQANDEEAISIPKSDVSISASSDIPMANFQLVQRDLRNVCHLLFREGLMRPHT